MSYTREEYRERVSGKISDRFGVRVKVTGKGRSSEPVDPLHPLVGATPRQRVEYQIELLELQKVEARQSGVRGENLERWLSKLQRKIDRKKEALG